MGLFIRQLDCKGLQEKLWRLDEGTLEVKLASTGQKFQPFGGLCVPCVDSSAERGTLYELAPVGSRDILRMRLSGYITGK